MSASPGLANICPAPAPPPASSTEIGGIPLQRSVLIADLPPEKKRRLWAHIKANDPALTAVLTGPETKLLLESFPGSSPVLDVGYVEAAIK